MLEFEHRRVADHFEDIAEDGSALLHGGSLRGRRPLFRRGRTRSCDGSLLLIRVT